MSKNVNRRVLYVGVPVLALVVLVAAMYFYNDTDANPEDFVKDFLALSYSSSYANIEETLVKQLDYYDAELRMTYMEEPPIHLDEFLETKQEMQIVSPIQTTAKKDADGRVVVTAGFSVEFKDITYPEGFVEHIIIDITLAQNGNQYAIVHIGGAEQ